MAHEVTSLSAVSLRPIHTVRNKNNVGVHINYVHDIIVYVWYMLIYRYRWPVWMALNVHDKTAQFFSTRSVSQRRAVYSSGPTIWRHVEKWWSHLLSKDVYECFTDPTPTVHNEAAGSLSAMPRPELTPICHVSPAETLYLALCRRILWQLVLVCH